MLELVQQSRETRSHESSHLTSNNVTKMKYNPSLLLVDCITYDSYNHRILLFIHRRVCPSNQVFKLPSNRLTKSNSWEYSNVSSTKGPDSRLPNLPRPSRRIVYHVSTPSIYDRKPFSRVRKWYIWRGISTKPQEYWISSEGSRPEGDRYIQPGNVMYPCTYGL